MVTTTFRQEAMRMINSMPDDTVVVLVDFLKRMMVNESRSDDHRIAGAMRMQRPIQYTG